MAFFSMRSMNLKRLELYWNLNLSQHKSQVLKPPTELLIHIATRRNACTPESSRWSRLPWKWQVGLWGSKLNQCLYYRTSFTPELLIFFYHLKQIMEELAAVISLQHTTRWNSSVVLWVQPALCVSIRYQQRILWVLLQTQYLQMVKNYYAKPDFNRKENLVTLHRWSTCSFWQCIWICNFREQRSSTGIIVTHWFLYLWIFASKSLPSKQFFSIAVKVVSFIRDRVLNNQLFKK